MLGHQQPVETVAANRPQSSPADFLVTGKTGLFGFNRPGASSYLVLEDEEEFEPQQTDSLTQPQSIVSSPPVLKSNSSDPSAKNSKRPPSATKDLMGDEVIDLFPALKGRDKVHASDDGILKSAQSAHVGGHSPIKPRKGPQPTGVWDSQLALESFPSLFFSVLGLLFAGILLDEIQHWQVFIQVSELIILVPVLLNLKGNLEMNMAARLGTAANLGHLDSPEMRWPILIGNLEVIQIQSIVIGFVAGVFSLIMGHIVHPGKNVYDDVVLTLSCSILTASLTSITLGAFLCGVVLLSRKWNINPDNISAPLAASLGDLITLGFLAVLALSLRAIPGSAAINSILVVLMMVSLPYFYYRVRNNRYVSTVIQHGWAALFISMFLSSLAGLTLERFIEQYRATALLCPILNGLAGNFGGVYTSRTATSLHANASANPSSATVIDEQEDRLTFWTLFWIHAPMQLAVLLIIAIFDLGHLVVTVGFVAFYIFVSTLVLLTVMYFTRYFCRWLWKRQLDPHHYAVPYMTAVGDVVGSLGLVIVFKVLEAAHDRSIN